MKDFFDPKKKQKKRARNESLSLKWVGQPVYTKGRLKYYTAVMMNDTKVMVVTTSFYALTFSIIIIDKCILIF